jgi:ATP dependent DNA ligase domain
LAAIDVAAGLTGFAILPAFPIYFSMPKRPFEPCIPTRGTKIPAGPDWIHEIKHDGYRLIVQRDGKRVRLFTRNGHDWTDRYPLIVEAALQNRSTSFVIDGESVLLGVDGVSDFDGLHSRRHDDEVRLYAFDALVADGDDLDITPSPLFIETCHHHSRNAKLSSGCPMRVVVRLTAGHVSSFQRVQPVTRRGGGHGYRAGCCHMASDDEHARCDRSFDRNLAGI